LKVRKSHIVSLLSIVIVAVGLIAIQYFHFRGVKDSLERLVEQRTNGLYKLDLGKTTYDFLKLDFKLRNARIYRIDTISDARIYSVELPYVRINLGSLESYFGFGQINVKEFVINEPVIVLRKEKPEKKQIQLSAEFSNLLKIVKDILDTFNIHSFVIAKGSFTLHQDSETFHINLIDFLAQEWNVRKLTNQSQIRIKIGGQNLDVLNHHISFSRIEYSYRKRQLAISDLTYHRLDSLTGAKLEAKAKTFIVYHIDWEELSASERYKLKRIELIDPEVKGSFPLSNKKKNAGDFSRILHDVTGEITIDSITVRNARLHMAYKQIQDSTSITFQDASFSITDFKLLNTKDLFEVGEVRFNLNRTELTVGKKYIVRFDSLFFNHYENRRLYVEGLEVAERNTKPFITSRQVFVSQFNPFDFLLDKRIKAESLELKDSWFNASMIIPEKESRRSMESAIEVDFHRLGLSNMKILYIGTDKSALAEGINLNLNNIHLKKNGQTSLDFNQLSARLFSYSDLKSKQNFSAQSVKITGREIKAKAIELNRENGLFILLNDVSLTTEKPFKNVPDHFSLFHAAKGKITGSVSFSGNNQEFPELKLDQLTVDTLAIDMAVKGSTINLQGADFVLNDIEIDSSIFIWKQLRSEITDLSVNHPEWTWSVKNSKINSANRSMFNQFKINKKDSTIDVQAETLAINSFSDLANLSGLDLIRPTIKIRSGNIFINGVMDSVSIINPSLLNKRIEKLNIYHPVVNMKINHLRSPGKKINHLELPDLLNELSVREGDVVIKSEKPDVFVYNLNASWMKNNLPVLSIDSLSTTTEKMDITLVKAELQSNRFSLSGISVTPIQTLEEYTHTGFERDFLKLKFNDLKLNGFLMDSLLFSKRIRLNEISMGSFDIDVLRDKRLPDPLFKKKPLFARLLNEIKTPIDIPSIRFSNGSVSVRQVSDKTLETGTIVINSISGEIKNVSNTTPMDKQPQLDATAQIFGQGKIKINYKVLTTDSFKLDVVAESLDFGVFNRMIQPLQSIRFKSGRLRALKVNAAANDSVALGTGLINYRDLRIEVLKTDKTNFRNEILSAIANEIIKNKRKNATADLEQIHEKNKTEFTYWMKILMKGASGATRHGKKQKRRSITS
jgi:beta-mannanase